jgi:hypothetical protein
MDIIWFSRESTPPWPDPKVLRLFALLRSTAIVEIIEIKSGVMELEDLTKHASLLEQGLRLIWQTVWSARSDPVQTGLQLHRSSM